jgi:hypothetical protein
MVMTDHETNEFDDGRCRINEAEIGHIKDSLDKLKLVVTGDNNGSRGLVLRMYGAEQIIDAMIKREEERKSDAKSLKTILLSQTVAIGAIVLWQVLRVAFKIP